MTLALAKRDVVKFWVEQTSFNKENRVCIADYSASHGDWRTWCEVLQNWTGRDSWLVAATGLHSFQIGNSSSWSPGWEGMSMRSGDSASAHKNIGWARRGYWVENVQIGGKLQWEFKMSNAAPSNNGGAISLAASPRYIISNSTFDFISKLLIENFY